MTEEGDGRDGRVVRRERHLVSDQRIERLTGDGGDRRRHDGQAVCDER
jgi:hypothetical protein